MTTAGSSPSTAAFAGRGVCCIVTTCFAFAMSFATCVPNALAVPPVFTAKCGGGGLLGGVGFICVSIFGFEFLFHIVRVGAGVASDRVVGVGLDFEISMHLCSSRRFLAFALAFIFLTLRRRSWPTLLVPGPSMLPPLLPLVLRFFARFELWARCARSGVRVLDFLVGGDGRLFNAIRSAASRPWLPLWPHRGGCQRREPPKNFFKTF